MGKLGLSLGVVGIGNMGAAFVEGLMSAGMASPGEIFVADIHDGKVAALRQRWKVEHLASLAGPEPALDAVLLAVKPQNLRETLEAMRPRLTPATLLISIAAGVRTEEILQLTGVACPLVRVMPNIAATIRQAISAIAPARTAVPSDVARVEKLFSAIGTTVIVEEKHMDTVTGLSGSGPAYLFMVIEALTDGGVKMGLPRPIALQLATQTVIGAGLLVKETGQHPAILKDQVTTPGGTTIWALHELESHGLRPMLISAVVTATEKSRELSTFVR